MGLVNAAGFPQPQKAEPAKKSKKTKAEAKVEEVVIPEECCALGCEECLVPQEEVQL